MPFGEKAGLDFDEVYSYLIKPVVEGLSLECTRSDEVTNSGWVHADMIKRIFNADVAIVDITSLNPNVFYELGVRHALRRSITILMRKRGTEIPFDIRGFRVLDYGITLAEAHAAQNLLRDFIKTGLRTRSDDSLVFTALPKLKVALE
jgi:hypothetical protein